MDPELNEKFSEAISDIECRTSEIVNQFEDATVLDDLNPLTDELEALRDEASTALLLAKKILSAGLVLLLLLTGCVNGRPFDPVIDCAPIVITEQELGDTIVLSSHACPPGWKP